MPLSPSAHVDTFTRDNLPPADQWPEFVFDLPELHYPDRLNCAAELLDGTIARLGGDRACVRDAAGAVWTYRELKTRVDRIARVLTEDFGVVPGNRVLLRGPNNPELVACWLAVLKAGAVVVTTMPLLRAGELATIGDIARVQLALCDARFVDDLVKADVPGMRIVEYGGDTAHLGRLAATKDGGYDGVQTAADDVALLAFTSGTTGRPKATMHFHRDVLAIADTFSAHVLKPLPDDLFAGSPPLAFTFGLGGLVIFPMRAGAASLLLERATPPDLFAAVAEHKVTVLFTAPPAYRAAASMAATVDLSSVRRCVSAGEALPKSTWEAFHDATGVRIIDGIGSTEILHIFIGSADDDIRPGSTGRPVPGYRAQVVDDVGSPVPAGTLGRLAVKGPTGCRYLADDRQLDYVQNGWNITGDTYSQDADGYFWYQARSDDLIISSGYNISPAEVEEALLRHPDIVECGVVGAPDPERGSMIVTAFVILREGVVASDETVRALQEFTKTEVAPYKCPRQVHFVTELPRTNTGKLQRFRLRELTRADSSDGVPLTEA
jgi:2-aminobenzoate-CoA ligase